MTEPMLSVVLCTHNPRADYFERALQSVARQTLPADQFEFVVVDNNSAPPIDAERAAKLAARAARVIREPRQGLSFARIAGINATTARLVCFIDDDNELAPVYFEEALRIAAAEPALGAFGGVAAGELEKPVSKSFAHFLPFFGVNDHGPEPLSGPGDAWGAWAPIGAGICVRREIAAAFASFVERSAAAGLLGRSGANLMSGEDSLFSRLACRLGHPVGYRPTLRLNHLIGSERLTLGYLARLMEGHGRSRVVLDGLFPQSAAPPADNAGGALFMNFLHRLKSHGPIRAYGMYFWDVGRLRQVREDAENPVKPTSPAHGC